jgi:hypothetical protein
MKQSPSWEANNRSASQENFRLLWEPLVHYCSPAIGPCSEPDEFSLHLLIIFPFDPFNIILPSMPMPSKWSFSYIFWDQIDLHAFPWDQIDLHAFHISPDKWAPCHHGMTQAVTDSQQGVVLQLQFFHMPTCVTSNCECSIWVTYGLSNTSYKRDNYYSK